MKPLARRFVAVVLAAALLAAQWPASAWAEGPKFADPVPPAQAMKFFRDNGVIKGDDDRLASYLGSETRLTPIGRTLYESMVKRYKPSEQVAALQPLFDSLRKNGPYNEARADNVKRALDIYTQKYGAFDGAPAGSVQESFNYGAVSEALMKAAAIPDAPRSSDHMQRETKEGYEFTGWDADAKEFNLAYTMDKNQVVDYRRDVQKVQLAMNANRPPDVPFIPQNGQYNHEMLQYTYSRLRAQEKEYIRAARVERMIALAELLGRNYPGDLWYNDPTLEADLIRDAKAKTYSHQGEDYNLFDIVEKRLSQRRVYLEGSRKAVEHFEAEMKSLKKGARITDSQWATMALNEQNSMRWLNLTVIETQMFGVKNMRERVDPTSPDAQMIVKIINESGMSAEQKTAIKAQFRAMTSRLDNLEKILREEAARLHKADYAESPDLMAARLSSTQKELSELSSDYALLIEAQSLPWLAKAQTHVGMNILQGLVRGIGMKGSSLLSGKYAAGMNAIDGQAPSLSTRLSTIAGLMGKGSLKEAGDQMIGALTGRAEWPSVVSKITDIGVVLSAGDRDSKIKAREMLIAINPNAAQYNMSGALNGEAPKVTDALRINSVLKGVHDHLAVVTETNKTLDAIATYMNWTVGVALMATPMRFGLEFVGKLSTKGLALTQAGAAVGGFQGAVQRIVGRTMIVVGEIANHTAAGLADLEPGRAWLAEKAGSSALKSYVIASGARALNVAAQQATFTVMSTGISGVFTAGTHLWDVSSLTIGGKEIMRRGHSMFSEDLAGLRKAAAMGAKGGFWWANEASLDFGWFKLPTAVLGFVGMPSTVFMNTRLAAVAEMVGSRGVVGTTLRSARIYKSGIVAVEAAEASATAAPGFLAKLTAAKWYTGGPIAGFGLSMIDNVAKYTLFSHAVGGLGHSYGWYVHTNPSSSPSFLDPQDDVERRIKRSNQIGQTWLASPAWMLIPTYARHAARDAAPYMLTAEGMKQYDKAGKTSEYANAPIDTHLKLDVVKPPLSQRLFQWRFFADPAPSEWIVTQAVKEAGIRKEMTRLAQEGGGVSSINPIEMFGVRALKSGDKFRTLHVTEEVQKIAYDIGSDALIAQRARTMEALTVKPGTVIKGWGRITPDGQIEIAKALYRAKVQLGRAVPPDVDAKMTNILGDYLAANQPIGKAGVKLRTSVVALKTDLPKLDAEQKRVVDEVLAWERNEGPMAGKSYVELTQSLRETAKTMTAQQKLSAPEGQALMDFYDYVLTGDKRFNYFNRTEVVNSRAKVIFEALRIEHANNKNMVREVNALELEVAKWAENRIGQPTDKKSAQGSTLNDLIQNLNRRVTAAGELGPSERAALTNSLTDVKNSAWVVRDAKGGPIPGWRDKQYVRLMQSFLGEGTRPAPKAGESEPIQGGILRSGRAGGNVELFVKAPTGVGKTLLADEGLLPYLEAEAAASKRKVVYLTFNTKLQAQGEFDFMAFNKIGSEVEFNTYEGLKTKIAEGKSKGRDIVSDYLMINDEMDAAGQQPALTIGMVTGYVTRLSGQTVAINESNASLKWALERLNTIRTEGAEVQAQRVKALTKGLSDTRVEAKGLKEVVGAADDILAAVTKLKQARGTVEIGLAETAIETASARLRGFVQGGVLGAEAESAAEITAALGRMKTALAERPAADAAVRAKIASQMEEAFLVQKRLLNISPGTEGLSRLPRVARNTRMVLENEIQRLQAAKAKAEAAGRPEEARILGERIELAGVERKLIQGFDGVDVSARLIKLDEKIAAIRGGQAPADTLAVNGKLVKLMRESVALEAAGTPEAAARRKIVDGRLDSLVKSMGASDANALREAVRKGASQQEIRALETSLGAVKTTPRIDALVREADGIKAGMTPERQAAHLEYRAQLDKVYDLSKRMEGADAAGRARLESERATARATLKSMEFELSASPAAGDLGGMVRRLELLSAQGARLEKLATLANARGERAGPLQSQLSAVRAEEASLGRAARAELLQRFDSAGKEIVRLTNKGEPGWEASVKSLIESRRAMQEAFAGDESSLYTAYRNMKESARPIGTDSRILEKPYEIPGGEGMDPAASLKRLDFLIERAHNVGAKDAKGAAMEPQLTALRAEMLAHQGKPASPEFNAMFDRSRKLELDLIRADAFNSAEQAMKAINGDSFISFLPKLPKLVWEVFRDKPITMSEGMGLTRYHAAKMIQALGQDPLRPVHQRDSLLMSYANSLLFPKGIGSPEKGSSYVRNEILSMVQGFQDDPAGVRMDHRTGRFNVVHNGQWFESMDNASRRWWELEYGADRLTLPYTHNALSTIKDVTTNKKAYFISLSGTAGDKFEKHMADNKIAMVGEGSGMPSNVVTQTVHTEKDIQVRLGSAETLLGRATRDQVVLRPTDMADVPADAKAAITEYLSTRVPKFKDPVTVQISEVKSPQAQAWLNGIRETQPANTGLIPISVPDMRVLRQVEHYLLKQGVKREEIAKVFADSEHLRLNVPQANVLKQMNIEGLDSGKVRYLLLDARVAGRGLDLNFKGDRQSTAPGAFRGYTKHDMYVVDPQKMSEIQLLQIMGRIDTGRTLSGAPRDFTLLMDIKSAAPETIFRDMFENSTFFVGLRKDPIFQTYAASRSGKMDWATVHDYIESRARDGSGEGRQLLNDYSLSVRESLKNRQLEVEANNLRTSSVLTDAPTTVGKFPALEKLR